MSSGLELSYSPALMARSRGQLRHIAAAAILEKVSSGNAPPGTPMQLASLADELQMSTTPVREALLLLAQEGWIVEESRGGFRVAQIRRRDVEDLYYVNEFASGELSGRAALVRTSDDVARLRRLDQQIVDLADFSDAEGVRLNFELHTGIYEIADAPRLLWFVQRSSAFVPRSRWVDIPGWCEHNSRGHGKILDAIERRSLVDAREHMVEHIHTAGQLVLEWFDAISFWE